MLFATARPQRAPEEGRMVGIVFISIAITAALAIVIFVPKAEVNA